MVITDGVLLQLAGRADVRKLLPELEGLQHVDTGCARCVQQFQTRLRSVCRQIYGLNQQRRDALKQLLGVAEIVFQFSQNGRLQQRHW